MISVLEPTGLRQRMAIGATAEPVRALDLQRLHDEGEFVRARGGELFELQVLEQIDAVLDDHHGVDRQAVAGLRRPHLDAAIVGRDHQRVLRDQPLAGRDADAGISRAVALVLLAHQLGPAGADDDGVAGLQLLVRLGERLLQVLGRDVVGGRQHVDALEAGDVDQHAAA